MSNPSKQKGTFMETSIKTYFQEQGFDAERIALQGKNDIGDVRILGVPVTLEVKNCKKIELSKWLAETLQEQSNAGTKWSFTIFKRKGKGAPADQFVLMTVGQLAEILGELFPDSRSL